MLLSKEMLSISSLVLISLELLHRVRPTSPLKLSFHSWKVNYTDKHLRLKGLLEVSNPHKYMEVMVPNLKLSPTLLGEDDLNSTRIYTKIINNGSTETPRKDSYWVNYIIKGHQRAQTEIEVTIKTESKHNLINFINSLWLEVCWINYGPFGYIYRREGVLIPLNRPILRPFNKLSWHTNQHFQILPIRTHLLGPLDDPFSIIKYYAGHLLESGDIITIGETPLAIIQGRFHHPTMVKVSRLARILCRFFHPTSSLATAVGLQTLIDIVGPSRVVVSWFMGTILKVVGVKGIFYRLAGSQARLIDDITGTTPPYDQVIVLGPCYAQRICEELSQKLKVSVAIVDVNDLGRVAILAKSLSCNGKILKEALKSNPAGNANEQTPLVLIRPRHTKQ
uniref:F420-0:Gamma-glutamyl ligase n=1 Tax=Paulinella longichromatophora TaxID=1708747 RepID=A0A2H4ZNY9_9EUKA|nr:hypothetical protein PLO_263 [Paulinella longichromatophora]